MIIIFPNGMGSSMWCDSKDGEYLMETVAIDGLIPHVDSTLRTIPERLGRILEGFSMGGAGTGRLGLRRPDLFAGISMLGAGPMTLDFMTMLVREAGTSTTERSPRHVRNPRM